MTFRVVPDLRALHGHETAQALRALADRADRGELLGVAVAAHTVTREPELAVAGVYVGAPELAHYAVSQLLVALLFPDD